MPGLPPGQQAACRGLTEKRVGDLYEGNRTIFRRDLEALPQRITKAQAARVNPQLNRQATEAKHATLQREADATRAEQLHRVVSMPRLRYAQTLCKVERNCRKM